MNANSNKEIKKVILKAHNYLYVDKKPQLAIDCLEENLQNNPDNISLLHWLGFCYLEESNFDKSKEIFLSIDGYYQAGFCELLNNRLSNSIELWKKCKNSEAKYWSQCFQTLVLGYIDQVPTFFGLRNHLEVDLSYLLRVGLEKYYQNIIGLTDKLAEINLETYKFVGRALLHNNFENNAVSFLIKSAEILPNDPETYYHLGQYALIVGSFEDARSMFDHCLILSPSYTPAKDRLNEIKNK